MRDGLIRRTGAIWFELLLLLLALALLFQIWPATATALIQALDVRNWSRGVWFVINCVVLLTLTLLRFAPQLWASWNERTRNTEVERAGAEERRKLKEQRETIARIIEGRKRRVY